MQESKNFKSNRLLRIFGSSNSILKTFVKCMNNWGWADTRQVRGIICRGIYVARNCKAVGTKYTQNNKENFRVSCNNKINWEALYEWRVFVVIHRDILMVGNCKSNGHKVSREYQRVYSKSSGAASSHLEWGALREDVVTRT